MLSLNVHILILKVVPCRPRDSSCSLTLTLFPVLSFLLQRSSGGCLRLSGGGRFSMDPVLETLPFPDRKDLLIGVQRKSLGAPLWPDLCCLPQRPAEV